MDLATVALAAAGEGSPLIHSEDEEDVDGDVAAAAAAQEVDDLAVAAQFAMMDAEVLEAQPPLEDFSARIAAMKYAQSLAGSGGAEDEDAGSAQAPIPESVVGVPSGPGLAAEAAAVAPSSAVPVKNVDAVVEEGVGAPASDSSSDSSDSDDEAAFQARVAVVAAADDGGVDSDDDNGKAAVLRTKNEVEPGQLPVAPVTESVTAGDTIILLGAVLHVKPGMVVIESCVDVPAIDEGSVVCSAERLVLGKVDEVFGPVSRALYTIRFPPGTDTSALEVSAGQHVFYVSQFVKKLMPERMYVKGCDASNAYDEEQGDEEVEYSDDEAEAAAKAAAKARRRGKTGDAPPTADDVIRSGMRGGRGGARGRKPAGMPSQPQGMVAPPPMLAYPQGGYFPPPPMMYGHMGVPMNPYTHTPLFMPAPGVGLPYAQPQPPPGPFHTHTPPVPPPFSHPPRRPMFMAPYGPPPYQ